MYGNSEKNMAQPDGAKLDTAAPDVIVRKPISLTKLRDMRVTQEKITMLTCYDASMARLMSDVGVDCLLVGDSLGMVLQGHDSTLPVTMDHIVYHTEAVVRGNRSAWVVADMPWGSYQQSPIQAYDNAARLLAAGANMVKLEGGLWMVETVRFLAERGVPVCAHIGLTPQYVHALGGYRVQGKDDDNAKRLMIEAKALADAGAAMLLFEMIPSKLAATITEQVQVPTIGIGAGKACSGQVLVIQDILNIFPGKKARFVKNYLAGRDSIQAAVAAYVSEVKSGVYPAPEHSFNE